MNNIEQLASYMDIQAFNAQSFSINPMRECTLFVYMDVPNNVLRLFINAMILSIEHKHNSKLLLKLMSLSLPQSAHLGISLGYQDSSSILWIGSAISLEHKQGNELLSIKQEFLQRALAFRQAIVQCVQDCSEHSREDFSSLEHTMDSLSNTSKHSQELMNLMSDSSILWG